MNLGNCYQCLGQYAKALALYKDAETIAMERGGLTDELANVYCNVGTCHQSMGRYDEAMTLHEECKKLAEAGGDLPALGRAYCNLGVCRQNLGLFAEAMALYAEHLSIAEQIGDQWWVGTAYGNMGSCAAVFGDYAKAFSLFETQYNISKDIQHQDMQAYAALGAGLILRLQMRCLVRSDHQVPSSGFQICPVPRPHDSSSVCAVEAKNWLQIALDGGERPAQLHLSLLAFDLGQQSEALASLKEYLSWRVEVGRSMCDGCGQTRCEDVPMLVCSGCGVARFCSKYHQKMASKSVLAGGNLFMGRHKHICGLLGKWRNVVKGRMTTESCNEDLLDFLKD